MTRNDIQTPSFRFDEAALQATVSTLADRFRIDADMATEIAKAAVEAYVTATPVGPAGDTLLDDILTTAFVSQPATVEDRVRLLQDAYHEIRLLRRREEARRRDPLPVAELSLLLDERLRRLGDLYMTSGQDWVLQVHQILTEPVCPVVSIRPEGSTARHYTVHADTVVGALLKAADLAWEGELKDKGPIPAVAATPVLPPEDADPDYDDEDAVREAYHDARRRLEGVTSALQMAQVANDALRSRLKEVLAGAGGEVDTPVP